MPEYGTMPAATNRDPTWAPARRVLADARTLAWPALRAAVSTLPGSIRPVCEYHFGWHDHTDGAGGGKGIRAALVLECARAVGGCPDDVVAAATAVELIHNASLIHDDIIDADAVRRHRPAVWSVFGIPTAILAGDSLFFLAIQVAARCPAPAVLEVADATQRLIDGEHADIAFETNRRATLEQCVAMAQAKTAALMRCACVLGGLCSGVDPERSHLLGQFGTHLGMAFQLVDDLLDIWGHPENTGRPTGSDLRRRKLSLPVVAALASGTDAGTRLADFYEPTAGSLTDQETTQVADLIEEAGGRLWARQEIENELESATACLKTAVPSQGDAIKLTALIELIKNRIP
ncbi:polyprenyl synthetase family protein [Nocardia sp. NPDC052566]|uniref:polyprenyl synthetase family protein n=1 Tax=Nocardia sp. NPDC052566 TaxID=3364330 RepID=UPI0037CC0389